ncbi:MAG: methyltransferase domain-containing protein [Verrucomicrobiota bacterium]|nr:methyltransferase domain-containing protein [Verrucomicrobiota bacterium]
MHHGAVNPVRKIAKLGQPLTYRRAWRRLRRKIYPLPLAPLLAQIDAAELAQLRNKHLPETKTYEARIQHYVKYLDVERFLKLNIARVQDLNLHRLPPLDVLDIGCGGGFFLFILNQLSHRTLGLDVDSVPLFNALVPLLKVERVVCAVQAFVPLPDFGRKFDLVTGFSTAFQGGNRQTWRWGVPEWEFFLDDLRRHLKPNGRVFLGLNPSYAGRFYTPEILRLFLSRGAKVERENVLLTLGKGL